jgi:hypothetical protein
MDLRDYPIGEDQIPARQATREQLLEEVAKTADSETKRRLQETANWREFFHDLHGRIVDGLTENMDAENLDMVQKLLDWETQSVIEKLLKEGSGKLTPPASI